MSMHYKPISTMAQIPELMQRTEVQLLSYTAINCDLIDSEERVYRLEPPKHMLKWFESFIYIMSQPWDYSVKRIKVQMALNSLPTAYKSPTSLEL